MEITHLKHNNGTRCGYIPCGFKSTSCLTETTCWDCIDAQFSSFVFDEKVEIHETDRTVFISCLHSGEVVASLKYYGSGSFLPIVMDVWVRPDFRGRGLATVIMKRIMKRSGPPIQLKVESFRKSGNEPAGLDDDGLRGFYAKLGFTALTTPNMMLWYPVVEKCDLLQVRVESEGGYYKAWIVGYPEIKGTGTSYNSAIGCLISEHRSFFGISFFKSDAVKSVEEI